MNKILLRIITPRGIFFNKKVEIATMKTTEGFIGIMNGKSPFVATLEISNFLINKKDSSNFLECAIAGGIVSVNSNKIEVITDAIEEKNKISEKRAEKSKKESEKIIRNEKEAAEIHMAEISLKKAINRLSVKRG